MEEFDIKPKVENKYNMVRLRKGSKEQFQFPKSDLK
jgi:hypothetical protein